MFVQVPRVLIAATASGVGKTTLVCGLLRAFARRGLRLWSYKCGPDYLDPQFHRSVLGIPSYNLDLFLSNKDVVRRLLAFGGGIAAGQDADLALIEGAMGYYDGIAQSTDASAYDVARATNTPVVLAVDARGRSLSVAAEVAGYAHFREPSHVAGVILNRATAGYAPTLKAMIEEHAGVPVLGYVPQLDDVNLEHRHLGLVAADEVADLQDKIDALANVLQTTVNLDALRALARSATPLEVVPPGTDLEGVVQEHHVLPSADLLEVASRHPVSPETNLSEAESRCAALLGAEPQEVVPKRCVPPNTKLSEPVQLSAVARTDAKAYRDAPPGQTEESCYPSTLLTRIDERPIIAVARDEAFNFYYEESLAVLGRLGARLAFFSPLHDKDIPVGACGLYVGGGYPELHARELSQNSAMLHAVRMAIANGMPTIAECGGFMYLHSELEDANGVPWAMVGVVPGRAFKTDHLQRFGYVTLTAHRDGLLAGVGESLPAHEFHYWDSDNPGDAFHAQKPQSSRGWDCVVSTPTLYAGFPHLYLAGSPDVAKRFVEACAAYGKRCAAYGGK